MPKVSTSVVDRDNPEWTAEDMARAVPFVERFPHLTGKPVRRTRGPQKAPTKQMISLRLSSDVVASLRHTGAGWQSRLDDALRAWVKRQPKAAKSR